ASSVSISEVSSAVEPTRGRQRTLWDSSIPPAMPATSTDSRYLRQLSSTGHSAHTPRASSITVRGDLSVTSVKSILWVEQGGVFGGIGSPRPQGARDALHVLLLRRPGERVEGLACLGCVLHGSAS